MLTFMLSYWFGDITTHQPCTRNATQTHAHTHTQTHASTITKHSKSMTVEVDAVETEAQTASHKTSSPQTHPLQ